MHDPALMEKEFGEIICGNILLLFKVELHLHLDGSVRYSTIWEYAQ